MHFSKTSAVGVAVLLAGVALPGTALAQATSFCDLPGYDATDVASLNFAIGCANTESITNPPGQVVGIGLGNLITTTTANDIITFHNRSSVISGQASIGYNFPGGILAGPTNLTFDHVLDASNSRGLVLFEGGILTHSGTTTVNIADLVASGVNAFSANSLHIVNADGVLNLNNYNQVIKGLSGTGQVWLNGGTLTVADSGGATSFTGNITKAFGGELIKYGSGKLTLGGTNEQAGTQVLGGTLELLTAASGGAGPITIAGATLAFGGSFALANAVTISGSATVDTGDNTASLDGVISGGRLSKTGDGKLTLSADNTYTGGTNVVNGTLRLMTAQSAGSGQIRLNGGTTLAFGNGMALNNTVAFDGSVTVDTAGNDVTLGGTVSDLSDGFDTLNKTGAGTLTLSGTNTYNGGTNIGQGTLALTNNKAASSGPVKIASGATLAFRSSMTFSNAVELAGKATIDTATNSVTMDGLISGNELTKTGAGNLTLDRANTYTGGTFVQAGQLTLTNAQSAGTGPIAMASFTTLGFDGSMTLANRIAFGSFVNVSTADNSVTLNGQLSGGGFNKTGSGVLTLGGVNTYSGGTRVYEGTLRLMNGQAAGTGPIDLASNTTLAFGASFALANNIHFSGPDDPIFDTAGNTVTLNGVISGAGFLTKVGAGTLITTAANTYTGPTTVAVGTLQVDGSIATSYLTTVNSGASLTGTGTVGPLQVQSGATVATGNPGTPNGTLNVAGNALFAPGSTLQVAVTPARASLLAVNGAATISGAGLRVAGTYLANTRYDVLTASSGVSGTFSTLSLPGQDLTVNYDPNAVYLQATLTQPTFVSVRNLADQRIGQLVNTRMFAQLLGGIYEQINCGDCYSTFGAVGSFSAGLHGRKSLTEQWSLVGGAAFVRSEAHRSRMDSTPLVALSARYDKTDMGKSRPFFEVGGYAAPWQRVRLFRDYSAGFGYGSSKTSSDASTYAAFARTGWVWRATERDEAAVYAEMARVWQRIKGYNEPVTMQNPTPGRFGTGTDTMNIVKAGVQWTHLFGSNIETQFNLGVAHGFAAKSGVNGSVLGVQVGQTYKAQTWAEYGARVGYRLSSGYVLDAFVEGTAGAKPIGNTLHGGLGLRVIY